MKSRYDLPPKPSLTSKEGDTNPPNNIIPITANPYTLVYNFNVSSFTGGKNGMKDGYDSLFRDSSSTVLIGSLLILCCTLSRRTSSMRRNILFLRDWIFSSSSSICMFAKFLTDSRDSMIQKLSGRATESSCLVAFPDSPSGGSTCLQNHTILIVASPIAHQETDLCYMMVTCV